MCRLLVFIMLLSLSACGLQNDERDLKDTISEIVALIDAGQDQKLISEYVYTEAGEHITSEIPDRKRQKLKAYLARAQELSPKFLENHTLAVYESAVFEKPLWFVKQQNRWRLMNKQPHKAN